MQTVVAETLVMWHCLPQTIIGSLGRSPSRVSCKAGLLRPSRQARGKHDGPRERLQPKKNKIWRAK